MLNLLLLIFLSAFIIVFFCLLGFVKEIYDSSIKSEHYVAEKPKHKASIVLSNKKSLKIICTILGIIGAFVGMNLNEGILGIIAGGALAGFTPYILIKFRENRLHKKMEKQIIQALSMIGNSMRSGKTLPQAIEEVSNSIPAPISVELSIVSRQMRIGVRPETCLKKMADRIGTPDIKLAVRAMLVSIKTGVNLPKFIESISGTILEREKVYGKIRVLTTQGKAQGIVLGVAPFVLLFFFHLSSPDYTKVLFTTVYGNILLGLIVVLQTIAYLLIRKIVSIKV